MINGDIGWWLTLLKYAAETERASTKVNNIV
jgi:hypothetical protein